MRLGGSLAAALIVLSAVFWDGRAAAQVLEPAAQGGAIEVPGESTAGGDASIGPAPETSAGLAPASEAGGLATRPLGPLPDGPKSAALDREAPSSRRLDASIARQAEVRNSVEGPGSEAAAGAAGRTFDRARARKEEISVGVEDGASADLGSLPTSPSAPRTSFPLIVRPGRGAGSSQIRTWAAAALISVASLLGPDVARTPILEPAPRASAGSYLDSRPRVSSPDDPARVTEYLSEMQEDIWQGALSANPELAFQLGVAAPEKESGPACYDWAGIERTFRQRAERLWVFGADWSHAMSASQKLDLTLIRNLNDVETQWVADQKAYRSSLEYFVTAPLGEIHSRLSSMSHPPEGRGPASDARRIGELLGQIPDKLAEDETLMREGLASGDIPNRLLVETDGIEASENSARFYETELPDQAERELGRDSAEAASIRASGTEAARALRRFECFLKLEVRPKAEDAIRVDPAATQRALRSTLALDDDPRTIFNRLVERFHRIDARLNAIRAQLKKSPRLQKEVAAAMSAHPGSDGELLGAYRASAIRAEDFIRQTGLIELPDDYQVSVELLPDALAQVAGAFYRPVPIFDDTRQGAFFVAPTRGDAAKLRGETFATIAWTTVHEALPGHDVQFRKLRENRDGVSKIRWLFPSGPNAEGWAMYVTELMRQRGYFTLAEELSYLSNERTDVIYAAWDLGIHAGLIRQEDVLKDLTAGKRATEKEARAQLYRMTKWPLQSTYYILGEMELEKLRADYQQKMGEEFTEAGFHDWFFRQGPIPIPLMRRLLAETPAQELP